jgi:hypothetical protein
LKEKRSSALVVNELDVDEKTFKANAFVRMEIKESHIFAK